MRRAEQYRRDAIGGAIDPDVDPSTLSSRRTARTGSFYDFSRSRAAKFIAVRFNQSELTRSHGDLPSDNTIVSLRT